jgi:iron complex transport system substrate-binding protein
VVGLFIESLSPFVIYPGEGFIILIKGLDMTLKKHGRKNDFPARIVCLSYDIVDILCSIGCGKKIIGKPSDINKPGIVDAADIGGFAKPNINTIIALKPDMVIGYSEICTKTMAELINRNINTLALQHTSLNEMYNSISLLGRITGNINEAVALIVSMQKELWEISAFVAKQSHRPVVYFEEWNKPYVCGVQWVSEIIDIAGGMDAFQQRSYFKKYLAREVTTLEVSSAAPDIILASWCGKPVDIDSFKQRPGWEFIPAVRTGRIYEVPGELILQPGPSLVKGAKYLHEIFNKHAN